MQVRSQITLTTAGGIPDVQAIVGDANWAGYQIYLWDSDTHYELIGSNNGSQPNNRFSLLRTPAQLVTCRMVWQGLVRPFNPGSDKDFSVECAFYQNDQLVTNYSPPPIAAGQFTGTFENVVIICSFQI